MILPFQCHLAVEEHYLGMLATCQSGSTVPLVGDPTIMGMACPVPGPAWGQLPAMSVLTLMARITAQSPHG